MEKLKNAKHEKCWQAFLMWKKEELLWRLEHLKFFINYQGNKELVEEIIIKIKTELKDFAQEQDLKTKYYERNKKEFYKRYSYLYGRIL